jgi:hypothetical protein
MSQTVFEKLELADEKNLLIQGLPSSIEKQFSKLSFAKNMTPLLKNRNGSKFWVAYPKITSKIVTDLNRDCSWNRLTCEGYESIQRVELDHVWSAMRFVKGENLRGEDAPPVTRKRQAAFVAD